VRKIERSRSKNRSGRWRQYNVGLDRRVSRTSPIRHDSPKTPVIPIPGRLRRRWLGASGCGLGATWRRLRADPGPRGGGGVRRLRRPAGGGARVRRHAAAQCHEQSPGVQRVLERQYGGRGRHRQLRCDQSDHRLGGSLGCLDGPAVLSLRGLDLRHAGQPRHQFRRWRWGSRQPTGWLWRCSNWRRFPPVFRRRRTGPAARPDRTALDSDPRQPRRQSQQPERERFHSPYTN